MDTIRFIADWKSADGTKYAAGTTVEASKELARELINKGIAVQLKVDGSVRSYSLKADGTDDDKPGDDDKPEKPKDDDDKKSAGDATGKRAAASDTGSPDKTVKALQDRVAELEGTISGLAKTPASGRKGIAPTGAIRVHESWTDDPKNGYQDVAEFLGDVASATDGNRTEKFLRVQKFLAQDLAAKGLRNGLPDGMKAVGSDENWTGEMSRGGALMPFEFRQMVTKPPVMPVISRSNGAQVIPLSSVGVQIPVARDFARSSGRIAGVTVFRDGERSTITATRGEFVQFTLIPQRISGIAHISGYALANNPALGNVIMEAMRDALNERENYEHLQGVGSGQSLGVMNQPSVYSVTRSSAGVIGVQDVFNMYARQFEPSLAVWLADIRTFSAIQSLTLPVGAGGVALPLVLPAQSGAAPGFTLLGRPIIFHTFGANYGTVGDLLFVSFNQYWIADHSYRKEDRTMFVRYVNDEDTFRLIVFTKADSHWPSTLVQRNTFEQTPFVRLAT